MTMPCAGNSLHGPFGQKGKKICHNIYLTFGYYISLKMFIITLNKKYCFFSLYIQSKDHEKKYLKLALFLKTMKC